MYATRTLEFFGIDALQKFTFYLLT